jgi:hypothetical protein
MNGTTPCELWRHDRSNSTTTPADARRVGRYADGHVIWLHIAWAIAHGKDNCAAEIPEDARRGLDEGLGRVVDFYERLKVMAVAAKERLRRSELAKARDLMAFVPALASLRCELRRGSVGLCQMQVLGEERDFVAVC